MHPPAFNGEAGRPRPKSTDGANWFEVPVNESKYGKGGFVCVPMSAEISSWSVYSVEHHHSLKFRSELGTYIY